MGGGRCSSLDSYALTILPPRVRVPSRPSMLLSFILKFVLHLSCEKNKNKEKEAELAHFKKKNITKWAFHRLFFAYFRTLDGYFLLRLSDRLHVGYLHAVGWGEGPWVLVAPVKALGVGVGFYKNKSWAFHSLFLVVSGYCWVDLYHSLS